MNKKNINDKNKIAILTSGGDSPGMNTVIYSVIKHCFSNNIEPYVIYEGYKGLVEGKIVKANFIEAEKNALNGGTYIYTSRLPEFAKLSVRKIAVDKLKKLGITNLIVVGGDGSYQGAKLLSELGIKCIGIPGTIDNDISSSDFTIGFFTALDSIDQAIYKIRHTCISHRRPAIIEVMGRYCGDLAVFSGITSFADLIITSENYMTPETIAERVKQAFDKNYEKRTFIIVISEKIYGCENKPTLEDIDTAIYKKINCKTNINRLGYLQRGGIPSALDRFLAFQMGMHAVELIIKQKFNRIIGISHNDIVDYSFNEAFKMKNPKRIKLINWINKINERKY